MGLGSKVKRLGFRIYGLWFMVMVYGLGFRVSSLGIRV